jgi:O-acetyl-ADP-ribose deacetylase (regulator of RNase III)
MSAGEGMFYRTQVVDGIVSEVGGKALRQACAALPEIHLDGSVDKEVRCPVGSAVATPAFGGLRDSFALIVHAVAPLSGPTGDAAEIERLLQECFASAVTAGYNAGADSLVFPLLGAGSRGVAVPVAAEVAARVVVALLSGNESSRPLPCGRDVPSIGFSVQVPAIAELLVKSIDREIAARGTV